MGIETALILGAVGTLGMAAAQGFQQASFADAQAAEIERVSRANLALEQEELTRQQVEVARQARDDRSDRIRQANAELGTLRAAAGDIGATDTNFQSLVLELGYLEGLDLSRIRANETAQIDSLQASKKAAVQQATDAIIGGQLQADATRKGAILSGIGTALQVGTSTFTGFKTLDILRNPAPTPAAGDPGVLLSARRSL